MEQKQAGGAGKKPVYFRKRDLFVLLAVLAVAGGLWLWLSLRGGGQAGVAEVTVIAGEERLVTEVPLNRDEIIHIEGAQLPVTLEVKDGAIRFIDSVCPDHICENTGWLRRVGEEAICAPARVVVRVEQEKE